MLRRGLALVLGLAALAACEPANEAQRQAMHWQACQSGLVNAQRTAACSAVIAAPGADVAQRVAALVQRGALYAQLNQDERAFADFGLALQFDASNTAALIQRGLLHQKRGAFGPAIVDFVAADRIDPASPGAGYREVAMAAEAAAYRTQISQLDGQIAHDDKNASLYNARCWLRAIVGQDLNGALDDCNKSLQLAPGAAEVLDSRGLVELKRGDYAAANTDYTAALTADPDRGHYLYGRALARIGLGMAAEGAADLELARHVEPGIDGLYDSYGVEWPEGKARTNN